jgi:hypothetical protein
MTSIDFSIDFSIAPSKFPVLGYYRIAMSHSRIMRVYVKTLCEQMETFAHRYNPTFRVFGDEGLGQSSQNNSELFDSLHMMVESQVIVIDSVESIHTSSLPEFFKIVDGNKLNVVFFKESIQYPGKCAVANKEKIHNATKTPFELRNTWKANYVKGIMKNLRKVPNVPSKKKVTIYA